MNKRGKRSGSRVRRYMRLKDTQLSNHHVKDGEPTWSIDISEASVTCNARRKRIVIEIHHERLDLFLESSRDCDLWYEALSNAKPASQLQSPRSAPARVPISPPNEHIKTYTKGFKVVQPAAHVNYNNKSNDGAFDSINKSGFTEVNNVLCGANIKSSTNSTLTSEGEEKLEGQDEGGIEEYVDDYDEDEADEMDQELRLDENGSGEKSYPQGEVQYEETPASMIFKQFNFPKNNNN